ncbi:hypothetical protein BFO01nite_18110 [Brevibacillus formosus]|uniref:Uncharacterized protein n=1 Tax=Brevibacillus formosus TaxID=54913 RepID=A0ABQ0T518_9BACL|nr:hypothetical protein BFO01nite_18110 [Brevibacillus formosus]
MFIGIAHTNDFSVLHGGGTSYFNAVSYSDCAAISHDRLPR